MHVKPCVKTGHQKLQIIKTNFQWCMLHLFSSRVVSQNSCISLRKLNIYHYIRIIIYTAKRRPTKMPVLNCMTKLLLYM